MASFEFSLENGLALIMPAGGSTACGMNFSAGVNDAVWKVVGDYEMTIDQNGNVTVCLRNMKGWIFPNKANYSNWFYYDTPWARAHNNCAHIWLDVANSRQAHGGWYDGNSAWQYGAGWKGGTGINGYDQWIKYRGDIVEGDCAGEYTGYGCCGAGSYVGSAKLFPDRCFNLGIVDFNTQKGFWIGANLDIYEGGWEQWQYVPFPIIVFEAPLISIDSEVLNICEEYATVSVHISSASPSAATGGTWEMQIADNAEFKNPMTYTKVNGENHVDFDNVKLFANKQYYIRGRIKVSDILYSQWATTTYTVQAEIPSFTAMVSDVTEMECYNIMHGICIGGGII